ncbi:hypothetical protein N7461_008421 [Penicillium sp. DV-2018c]|nr:hypothetical protein N7461_008421 [Penicillium sp. DV-2018c]
MDVDSPNPNSSKRSLSGQFPSSLPSAAVRDPRLAGSRTPKTRRGNPTAPVSLPSDPRSPVGLPRAPSTSSPTKPSTPRPQESRDVSSHQSLHSISDLVNSLIKVNKAEEQKERLQKEIPTITKNLQRAKQSQQFPSVIAAYQQQLDAAQDELSSHIRAIDRNRIISARAQDTFTASLSQPKLQPQLENIPERIEKLESQFSAVFQAPNSTATAVQRTDRDIGELKAKLQKVEEALGNSSGLQEALDYMKKIANSVAHQSKRYGQFTAKISSIENEMNSASMKLEEKVSIVKKMVNTVETEMKHSNEQLEKDISTLGSKVTTMNVQIKDKLSPVEEDITSLEAKAQYMRKHVSAKVSDFASDLEAQRNQTAKAITTQEARLEDLRRQQQHYFDNDERLLSDASNPTTHGGVLARLADLERKIQAQTTVLNQTKQHHSEVDSKRLSELAEQRKTNDSRQALIESKYDETLLKVEGITKKQVELDKNILGLRNDLSGAITRLQGSLLTELKEFGTRLADVPVVMEAVKKCENQVDIHSKGIRSLEQRWGNITTGDLVNSMARAMQEMYPSVDQLSQRFSAHQSEIEIRFSELRAHILTLKAGIETSKAAALGGQAGTDQSRLPPVTPEQLEALDQIPALLRKVNDLSDSQAGASSGQADTGQSRIPQVTPEQLQSLDQIPALLRKVNDLSDSQAAPRTPQATPEQLQALDQVSTLLQKVNDLSSSLTVIDQLAKGHTTQLNQNLEQLSQLHNKFAAHEESIAAMAEKADEQEGRYEEFTETMNKFDALTERFDAHVLELESFRGRIKTTLEGLTDASQQRGTTVDEDLAKVKKDISQLQVLQQQAGSLTRTMKERQQVENAYTIGAVKDHTSRLDKISKTLEGLTQVWEKQKAAENVDLNKVKEDVLQLQRLREQVQSLTRIAEGRDAPAINGSVTDSFNSRLNALERPPASDEGFPGIEGGLEGLQDEFRNLENGFRDMEESAKGYLRRLRKVEDIVSLMKLSEGSPSNRDVPDRPMGQRIEWQGSPRRSGSDGPSFPSRSAASPTAFPKGPQLGGYQPLLKVNAREQPEKPPPKSYQFPKQGRQPPPGPSNSNSHPSASYNGNYTGLRPGRNGWGQSSPMPLDDDDEDDELQTSSPFSYSSSVPGSSGPPSFPGSGKKDKKRKKRGVISEEAARAMKRAKKRKHPMEED